jgi:hypothetical protein
MASIANDLLGEIDFEKLQRRTAAKIQDLSPEERFKKLYQLHGDYKAGRSVSFKSLQRSREAENAENAENNEGNEN